MLIKQSAKEIKILSVDQRSGLNEYYKCSQCFGKHFYYGSATPENLKFCGICELRGWMKEADPLDYSRVAPRSYLKINPVLKITRNNTGPHRR